MASNIKAKKLLPGLVQFSDSCNVYVIGDGERCIAIDYGSGAWRKQLAEHNLGRLDHVYLTHHHADQCAGLESGEPRDFEVHAPPGERDRIDPDAVPKLHRPRIGTGMPLSLDPLSHGIADVSYDMAGDHFRGNGRLRFVHTPGHGPGAVSVIADIGDKQVVFCGDAAHHGATVHQPFHLEWDHYRGDGALAAYQGVRLLADVGMDLLCPSHGKVIRDKPRNMLKRLARKLLAFYEAKGNICPGEHDHYLAPQRFMHSGAKQLLPSLYHFGVNGYLIVSPSRDALLVDPQQSMLGELDALLGELGDVTLTDMIATHYHCDHVDGAPQLMRRGVKLHLHPRVAGPLTDPHKYEKVFFKIDRKLKPDSILPRKGVWRWNDFRFRIAPFPGQTWWHAAHLTEIDGRRVLFGGDNFQPNSRWQGTGGFSSFNGSRFDGFAESAQLVLDWKPDIIANGHRTYVHFHPSQFRKIIQWARRAEKAVADLCPSGDLEKDYYVHRPER